MEKIDNITATSWRIFPRFSLQKYSEEGTCMDSNDLINPKSKKCSGYETTPKLMMMGNKKYERNHFSEFRGSYLLLTSR